MEMLTPEIFRVIVSASPIAAISLLLIWTVFKGINEMVSKFNESLERQRTDLINLFNERFKAQEDLFATTVNRLAGMAESAIKVNGHEK